ncbi:MAG: helix-turn-helix domain-containing protein [Oscillospiraceae bacterium]
MEKYHERIRNLREDHDLKQSEVAEVLHLTNQQAYQRYESGRVKMPVELLTKLAVFYDVSLDYIVGLTDDKSKKW